MFQSALLKGALVALAVLEKLVEGDALNPDDIVNFPDFADAITHGDLEFDWVSHPVVTLNGYEIMLFHINSKVPAAVSKGPLLLVHGMFSSPEEFLFQTDETVPAWPL